MRRDWEAISIRVNTDRSKPNYTMIAIKSVCVWGGGGDYISYVTTGISGDCFLPVGLHD